MENPAKIIVVGASARALMQSAAIAGIESVGIDFFGDFDAKEIGNMHVVSMEKRDWLDHFQKAIDQESRSEKKLAWIYTGGLENQPDLIEEMSKKIPLLGCDSKSLSLCRDPSLVQKTLVENGYADASCEITLLGDFLDSGKRWLIKPFRSAGGQSIQILEAASDLVNFKDDEYFLQAFQAGQVHSSVFLAYNKPSISQSASIYLGTTKQLENRQQGVLNSFQYTGSIGPVSLSRLVEEQIWSIADLFINHFDLNGLFGIDYVLGNDGVKILEINPRYPASSEILEFSLQKSFVGMLFKDFLCSNLNLTEQKKSNDSKVLQISKFVGKQIVYAESDLVVPVEWDWNQYRTVIFPEHSSEKLADLPMPGTRILKGQPMCTVLVYSNDLQKCEDALNKSSSEIIRKFHHQWKA